MVAGGAVKEDHCEGDAAGPGPQVLARQLTRRQAGGLARTPEVPGSQGTITSAVLAWPGARGKPISVGIARDTLPLRGTCSPPLAEPHGNSLPLRGTRFTSGREAWDRKRRSSPLVQPHGTALDDMAGNMFHTCRDKRGQPSTVSCGGHLRSAEWQLDSSSRSPTLPEDGQKARGFDLLRPHEVDWPLSILFFWDATPGFVGTDCRFADSYPTDVGLATQCRRSGRAKRGCSLPPGANNLLFASCWSQSSSSPVVSNSMGGFSNNRREAIHTASMSRSLHRLMGQRLHRRMGQFIQRHWGNPYSENTPADTTL